MARRSGKSKLRRLVDYLVTAVVVLALAVGVVWLEQMNAETISAPARVIDGDSLVLDGFKVRLVGIDAPELDQFCQAGEGAYPCGRRAREHLQALVGIEASVACRSEGEDKYGRMLAECFSGSLSLNAQMVRDGWAVSYGDFLWLEREARKAKRGVWIGEFERPDQWRIKAGGLVETHDGALIRRIWRRLNTWLGGESDGFDV